LKEKRRGVVDLLTIFFCFSRLILRERERIPEN
jgi:hypothetical protein